MIRWKRLHDIIVVPGRSVLILAGKNVEDVVQFTDNWKMLDMMSGTYEVFALYDTETLRAECIRFVHNSHARRYRKLNWDHCVDFSIGQCLKVQGCLMMNKSVVNQIAHISKCQDIGINLKFSGGIYEVFSRGLGKGREKVRDCV